MLSAQTENLQTKVIDGKEFYIYKVKPSEGFYVLSQKFGISQEEIIRYNPAAKNGLKRGQLLMIPTHRTAQGEPEGSEIESTFEHTIVRGESLYSISKMYKVTIQSIIDLNPGSERGIKAGATLKIPQRYKKNDLESPKQGCHYGNSQIARYSRNGNIHPYSRKYNRYDRQRKRRVCISYYRRRRNALLHIEKVRYRHRNHSQT